MFVKIITLIIGKVKVQRRRECKNYEKITDRWKSEGKVELFGQIC